MSNRRIEIDLDDYIELLKNRKREVAANFGWTIPDGVWDYFLEILDDCGIGENSNPSYVVDNLAVNGDYGPVEGYGLLAEMVQHVIDLSIDEDNVSDEDDAKEYLADLPFDELRDLAESLDRGSAFFFYEEPDGEYGLGVCYSL